MIYLTINPLCENQTDIKNFNLQHACSICDNNPPPAWIIYPHVKTVVTNEKFATRKTRFHVRYHSNSREPHKFSLMTFLNFHMVHWWWVLNRSFIIRFRNYFIILIWTSPWRPVILISHLRVIFIWIRNVKNSFVNEPVVIKWWWKFKALFLISSSLVLSLSGYRVTYLATYMLFLHLNRWFCHVLINKK